MTQDYTVSNIIFSFYLLKDKELIGLEGGIVMKFNTDILSAVLRRIL